NVAALDGALYPLLVLQANNFQFTTGSRTACNSPHTGLCVFRDLSDVFIKRYGHKRTCWDLGGSKLVCCGVFGYARIRFRITRTVKNPNIYKRIIRPVNLAHNGLIATINVFDVLRGHNYPIRVMIDAPEHGAVKSA